MNLEAYLERIHFQGVPRTDFETLKMMHRLHALHVPYENLDVHLGNRIESRIEATLEKMITRRRGGWCYEQNGLFAWALEEVGFDVVRLAGGSEGHLPEPGNHLLLLVTLDQEYIADVGLGDGLMEPIPLKEHATKQGFLEFRLHRLDDGRWQFHNHPRGSVKTVEFRVEPAAPAIFEERIEWLQTAPESPFFSAVLGMRYTELGAETLVGRVRRTLTADGPTGFLIQSADEFVNELRVTFGIEAEGLADLWPAIVARHDEIFADRDVVAAFIANG